MSGDGPPGLEERLGYQFGDRSLLARALTHASARPAGHTGPVESNERLEFLGDSVLQLVLTEELAKRYPEDAEGVLTTKRATLVRGSTLAALARELAIAPCLRVGESPGEARARDLPSTLENALEAIAGAIFLDGGFAAARAATLRWYGPLAARLENPGPDLNPKGRLQELVQPEHGNDAIAYVLLATTGRDHERRFEVALHLLGQEVARGEGPSKKAAEEAAARAALPRVQGGPAT